MRVNVRHPKSEPWRGKFERGMRCLVPADAFCEYQDGPSPKAKRWFARPDGKPFFFAGTWMPWAGARGTKKNSVTGTHELFTILTVAPNNVVKPVHRKAMPVMLTSDADLEVWLAAETAEALKLQRPASDEAVTLLTDKPGS